MSLDLSTYAWSLDGWRDLSDPVPFVVIDSSGNAVSEARLRSAWVGKADAIEGKGALELGGDRNELLMDLRPLVDAGSGQLGGRRIEISFWQRPRGTWLAGSIGWPIGDLDAFWRDGSSWGISPAGTVDFQRTGRATDDGWEEWSSGPIDFELGGDHPPGWLFLEDAQVRGSEVGGDYTVYRDDARVILDALEIRDLGPALAHGASCNARTEQEVCGPGTVCLLGRCTDAAQREGQVVLEASHRRDFLQNLVFAYQTFDGSRETARHLPLFRFAAATLIHETHPERFWRSLRQGVESFHDGHAYAPGLARLGSDWAPGACLLWGEADLLPGARQLPLVTRVQPGHPLGARLQPGDALVAIDGLPVRTWAELADFGIVYAGDPGAREVVETGRLLGAAFELGSRLRFERCPRLAADGACAAPIETVTIDLGRVAENAIWGPELPPWFGETPGCNNRVERVAPLDDPEGWDSSASTELDGVRYLSFNGMPPTKVWGGSGLMEQTFTNALADSPPRAILDSRLGYGGYPDMVAYTLSFFLAPGSGIVHLDYPNLSVPLDRALRESLGTCTLRLDGSPCAGTIRFSPDDWPEPYLGVASSTRVALLLTNDVSANDIFPRLLRARAGPTRFFGPGPTWGAFGWILYLPEVQPGAIFGSLQVTDSVFFDRSHDDPLDFRTGRGVVPEVIVLQTQSDLLRGVDTVMEAARAWVKQ